MTTPSALREIAIQNRTIETNQKAAAFADVARWLMVGRGNMGNAVHTAQGAGASEIILDGIKAAVGAGSMTDPNFAAPLAIQTLADAFLLSLRNIGVFDNALQYAVNVPLNTQIALTTLGATASSVGEGSARIISKITLANAALTPRSAVAIIVSTTELLRAGGDKVMRLFQQELARAIAAETDSRFLSLISAGITGTPSQGSNAFGIASDMAALFGALSTGAGSKLFVALNPSDLKHMSLQIGSNGQQAFPGLSYAGGTYAGAIFVPTDALSGTICGFDASQLVMGSTGVELDASNQASVQMDSVPDSPVTAATPGPSFFQLNQTGLRAIRYFGAAAARPNAVAVISNVSYGSANSPA